MSEICDRFMHCYLLDWFPSGRGHYTIASKGRLYCHAVLALFKSPKAALLPEARNDLGALYVVTMESKLMEGHMFFCKVTRNDTCLLDLSKG